MTLFRPEALRAQQQRLHGAIVLTRPLSFTVLTTSFVLGTTLMVAFFFTFSVSRKEVVAGVVVPESGVISVQAGQGATVLERRVRVGQAVRANDVLFVLTGERGGAQGDTQRRISTLLQERAQSLRQEAGMQEAQAVQRRSALEARLAQLRTEQAALKQELALQRERVALAEQDAARVSALVQQGFVSESQWRDKQAQVIEQRARLVALQRAQAGAGRESLQVGAELDEVPLEAEREARELERRRAAAEQELLESESRRQIVLRAPVDGMVTAVHAHEGQPVDGARALAALVPAGSRMMVELHVPTRAIGFVREGTEVLMRLDAFPYQKFGQQRGTVTELSRTAIGRAELARDGAETPGGAGEPMYRLRVALEQQQVMAYGRQQPLAAGMQLQATLVLERRRLAEWVVEPLLALGSRT